MSPPLLHRNFGGVPIAPDRPRCGPPNLKLISRKIIVITVPERHGQTDRQTDRRTDGRTHDLLWHNHTLHCILQ